MKSGKINIDTEIWLYSFKFHIQDFWDCYTVIIWEDEIEISWNIKEEVLQKTVARLGYYVRDIYEQKVIWCVNEVKSQTSTLLSLIWWSLKEKKYYDKAEWLSYEDGLQKIELIQATRTSSNVEVILRWKKILLGTIKYSPIQSWSKFRSHNFKFESNHPEIDDLLLYSGKYIPSEDEVKAKIYDLLSQLEPDEFVPQKKGDWKNSVHSKDWSNEDIENKEQRIEWQINNITYTLFKVEDDSWNAGLEFEYKWQKYVTHYMKSETLWKKRYFFLFPEWSDRNTQNSFRKRIGSTWKDLVEWTRGMLKNIARILDWNKPRDKEIIKFLESLRK